MNEIEFNYASVNGIRLHYATAGSGEKLVVLLHGFPEFWYSWRHQIVALNDEYTVVARFELPNLKALNFLLHESLGGGTRSLMTDAQGKTFSTALLRMAIDISDLEAESLDLTRKLL